MRIAARECLLTVLLILRTRAGRRLAAVEILLPAAHRTLEHVIPLR
jgi:hypothetical protein